VALLLDLKLVLGYLSPKSGAVEEKVGFQYYYNRKCGSLCNHWI